ncbi:MAG TPA: hypothetical protein VIL49_18265, partial [Capillimicrobium sp.]
FFGVQRFFARLDRFIRVSRSEVAATGRLLAVRDVTLSSEGGRLSAQVLATVYVLPDLQSALSAVDGSGGAPPATPPADPSAGSTLATAGVAP